MGEAREVVGRESEVGSVSAFLDAVAAGASAFLLEGEIGIGKTTLWRDAVAAAGRRRQRVLSCRPAEAEIELPFAALGDLLEGVGDEVLAWLPGPQREALDMAVDGTENDVYEVHTESTPVGPENPHGNAFRSVATHLRRESEAQQVIDPLSGRFWRVSSSSARNGLGEPAAYKLVPGANVLPFAAPDSSVRARARFMERHLWVTPYAPRERYPAGDYPNQHPGGAGLPEWMEANRSLESTNLVLWYSFGRHMPRPEDWPVMPVARIGFALMPDGFFDANPALDVPPSPHARHCHPR